MTTQRKKNPKHSAAKSNDQAEWPQTAEAFCRLGGFATQLDQLRLRFFLKYQKLLQEFRNETWKGWAWPTGACRFAPGKFGQQLFEEQKGKLEKRSNLLGLDSEYYDGLINTITDSKFRLHIPQQLAICAGIQENSMAFVLPHSQFIEVWERDRLARFYRDFENRTGEL